MWISGCHHAQMLKAFYLNFISGDLANNSSHICGSWYLPMFLFRDGSFTLINIASLMVLAIFFMSYPRSKRDIPLRPIVSSRGSINYEVAKELSRILRPLVDSSPHHIKNTGDFVQQLKGITKSQWKHSIIWCLCTFYICAHRPYH